jgi:hypothetical protein
MNFILLNTMSKLYINRFNIRKGSNWKFGRDNDWINQIGIQRGEFKWW